MMEAVRILKAARLKVRRTVRIGLWSGEEQGQQGSRAYVREHFYDRATGTKKPEHSKLSVYFNSDAGAGAIRGVALEEIEAVAPIFAAWMEPLRNMDMTALPIRHTLSTDVVQFDLAGLPAFQFVQDPLDYSTRAHHTNMDTYERVPPFDLMGNAVKVAFFVYQAANRDQLLPRKPMPAVDSATSFSRPAVGLFNFRGWTDELTHFSSCIGWFAGGFIGGAQQRLRFVPHPWPEAPAEQR